MFRTNGKLRFINNEGGEFVPNVLEPEFITDENLVLRFGDNGVFTPWVTKREHIDTNVPFQIGASQGMVLDGDYNVDDTLDDIETDCLLVCSYNTGYNTWYQRVGVLNLSTNANTVFMETLSSYLQQSPPCIDSYEWTRSGQHKAFDTNRGFFYIFEENRLGGGVFVTRWSADMMYTETRRITFITGDLTPTNLFYPEDNILEIFCYSDNTLYSYVYNWETEELLSSETHTTTSTFYGGFLYPTALATLAYGTNGVVGVLKNDLSDQLYSYRPETILNTSYYQEYGKFFLDVLGRPWILANRSSYSGDSSGGIVNVGNIKTSKHYTSTNSINLESVWGDPNSGFVYSDYSNTIQQTNPFDRYVNRCSVVKNSMIKNTQLLSSIPFAPLSTSPSSCLRKEIKVPNGVLGVYHDSYSGTPSKIYAYFIDDTTHETTVLVNTTLGNIISYSGLTAYTPYVYLLQVRHCLDEDLITASSSIEDNIMSLSFTPNESIDDEDLKYVVDWGDGNSTAYLSNGNVQPTITSFSITNLAGSTSIVNRISIQYATNFSVTFSDPDKCITAFLFHPGGSETSVWVNINNPTINGNSVTQTFTYRYMDVSYKIPQITKIQTTDSKIYSIPFPSTYVKKYVSGTTGTSISSSDTYYAHCVPVTTNTVSTATVVGNSSYRTINVTAPDIVSNIDVVWYNSTVPSIRKTFSNVHHGDTLELPFLAYTLSHYLQLNVTLIDGTLLSYVTYTNNVGQRSTWSAYTIHEYSDTVCVVESNGMYFEEGVSNVFPVELGVRKYLHYDEVVDITNSPCVSTTIAYPPSFTSTSSLNIQHWWDYKYNNVFHPSAHRFYVSHRITSSSNANLYNSKLNSDPVDFSLLPAYKFLVTQKPIPLFDAVDYDGYSIATLDTSTIPTNNKIMRTSFIRERGIVLLKIFHGGIRSYRNIAVYVNEILTNTITSYDGDYTSQTNLYFQLDEETNTIDVVVSIPNIATPYYSSDVGKDFRVQCSESENFLSFETSEDVPSSDFESSYHCPLGTEDPYMMDIHADSCSGIGLWIKRVGGNASPFKLFYNLENAVSGDFDPDDVQPNTLWWINTDEYPENEWVSNIIYLDPDATYDLKIKAASTIPGDLYITYAFLFDNTRLPIRSFKDDFDGYEVVTTPPNIYMSDYQQNYASTNRFYWEMDNIPVGSTTMSFYVKVLKHPWSDIGNYEYVYLYYYTSAGGAYLGWEDFLSSSSTICTFDDIEWKCVEISLPEGIGFIELRQNSYQCGDWQLLMTTPEFTNPYSSFTERVELPPEVVIDYGSWILDPIHQYDSLTTYVSNDISNNQSTSFTFDVTVSETSMFSCFTAVSSESGYDYLKIYVDDVVKISRSGYYPFSWQQTSVPLEIGTHTIKVEYMKDVSVSSGVDCAWVSDFHLLVEPSV